LNLRRGKKRRRKKNNLQTSPGNQRKGKRNKCKCHGKKREGNLCFPSYKKRKGVGERVAFCEAERRPGAVFLQRSQKEKTERKKTARKKGKKREKSALAGGKGHRS